MPKNATIQIKTLTPRQAINRTNENLRLGEKFKETKNIVVLKIILLRLLSLPRKKREAKRTKKSDKRLMPYEHQSRPIKNAFLKLPMRKNSQ